MSPPNEDGAAPDDPRDDADEPRDPAPVNEPVDPEPTAEAPASRQPDDQPRQLALPGMGDDDTDETDAVWDLNSSPALAKLASQGDFSADNLRALVGLPSSRNRVGGLFRRAKRDGLIVEVAATPSAAASRRGGLVRIWRRAA